MKVNELAKLTGISVRTLHYYDEIDLLKPAHITEAGYRIYDQSALAKLQQILFFRELGFTLNEIKSIMANPSYDKTEALTKHKELLLQKRKHLDNLIKLVDQTIKGEDNMSFKEFDMSDIEAHKQKYAAEVKERWGNSSAYAESEKKTSSYSQEDWQEIWKSGGDILEDFSKIRNLAPESSEAQELVKKWQDFISASFYQCSKEILSGLGLMYVHDERFTESIDQHGPGTAAFMAAAIEVYCAK